eukprot:4268025-Pyramimonas_sp.AAC.1
MLESPLPVSAFSHLQRHPIRRSCGRPALISLKTFARSSRSRVNRRDQTGLATRSNRQATRNPKTSWALVGDMLSLMNVRVRE